MIYDDGSEIGVDPDTGMVYSTDTTGFLTNDPLPAPQGWSVFSQADAGEASKMGGAYPQNGAPWWDNAAMLGISRVIDSAARTYVAVKGSVPAGYAGQDGRTYAAGTTPPASSVGKPSGLMVLLLAGLAVAAFAG